MRSGQQALGVGDRKRSRGGDVAGDPSHEPVSEESTPTERDRKGPVRAVLRVLSGTDNLITKAAALLGAIGVLGGAVTFLVKGSPPPPVLEASFMEARVEPNVLLEQYEARTQTSSADFEPHAPKVRSEPAVYVTTGSSRRGVDLVGAVSADSTVTGAISSTAPSGGEISVEAERKEAERLHKEAQQTQTQAEREQQQAQTQAETEQKRAQKQAEEEGKQIQNRGEQESKREQERVRKDQEQQTRLHRVEELRHQAQGKAEEAAVRSTEAAKLKQEETNPASTVPKPPVTPQLHREGDAEVAAGTAAPQRLVEAVAAEAGVKPGPAIAPTIEKAIADYSANLDQAARQVAATFRDSRQGVVEHKRQPLGVGVSYSVDFVGYAGRLMVLEWTLCSTQTGPLPREWWRNVIVKLIRPTSDKTKVAGNFWAPVPPRRGDYYFRLRVFDGDTEAAHIETDRFH